MSKSQIEPNEFVSDLMHEWGISRIQTAEDLNVIHKNLHSYLRVLPFNDKTKAEEELIRWKRTGAEVLRDKFVYQGKACTDYVVAFLTLVHAGGVNNTRFVKLKNKDTEMVHSVAEIEVEGIWYIFDVGNPNVTPKIGEIHNEYGNYKL